MEDNSKTSEGAAGSRQELALEHIEFKERQNLKKCLKFMVVLFFLTTIVFLVLFLIFYFDSKKEDIKYVKDSANCKSWECQLGSQTCTTWDCLQLAADVSVNVDPRIDPCKDFYQFACGRWAENHPLSGEVLDTSPLVNAGRNTQKAVRDLLQDRNPDELDAIKKAKDFYQTCLDTKMADETSIQSFAAMAARPSGEAVFPSIMDVNAVNEKWTLNQVMQKVLRFPVLDDSYMEYNPIIPMTVKADYNQSDKNVITEKIKGAMENISFSEQHDLDVFSTTLSEMPANYNYMNMYIQYRKRNSSFFQQYESLYKNIVSTIRNSSSIADDAKAVVDLEILIRKATASNSSKDQGLADMFTRMTIAQLNQRYPQLDWLEYLQHEFSPVGITLTLDDEVLLEGAKNYYDNIMPVLNTTSRRTLLNYAQWVMLYKYAQFMTEEIREYMQAFIKEQNDQVQKLIDQDDSQSASLSPEEVDIINRQRHQMGQALQSQRWPMCFSYTIKIFPEAVGRLYVDAHLSDKTIAKVGRLVKDLKDAFREILRNTTWMSVQTKQAAIGKLDAITDNIGYPPRLINDTYLNESRKNVQVNSRSPLDSVVNAGTDVYRRTLGTLRQPVDKQKWPSSTAVANAFYDPLMNSIYILAGILQKPFYNEKNLDVLVYGGIGQVIGHELTHGFDDSGAQYDKDGNLRKWWPAEDIQDFKRLGDCMANQYSKYHTPDNKYQVDGKRTLGENIADNGGLKEAYKAYKNVVAKRGGKEDPRLPLLNYTTDQLFFIAYAHNSCQNIDDTLLWIPYSDSHSPNMFRVIGPLQNSIEFAKAFNCPVGSYMNPEKKCHIW